jgi:hypothetical protein
MRRSSRHLHDKLISLAAALVAASLALPAAAQVRPVLQGTKDTRIGKIEFDKGFPSG